jgi:hypothetical protein
MKCWNMSRLMPDQLITLGKRPRCFNGSWQGEQTKGRTDEKESGSSSSPGSRDRRNLSRGKMALSVQLVWSRFVFIWRTGRPVPVDPNGRSLRTSAEGKGNGARPEQQQSATQQFKVLANRKTSLARCKAATSWTCSQSPDHFFYANESHDL